MKFYSLFFSFLLICIFSFFPTESYASSVDDIFDNFSEEEEAIFQEAEECMPEVHVVPPSRVSIAMRRVWDRLLIIYLWMKIRYARFAAYMRNKVGMQPAVEVPLQA